MKAGISMNRMKIKKVTSVSILALGKRMRYAPSTPDIAPLAPTIGILDSGLVAI